MKTIDAFALRDFDASRILSRTFFKQLRFANGLTDNEILNSLTPSDDAPITELEKKLDELNIILIKAADYQTHIKRHCGRLTRYINVIANKIAAANADADIATLRGRYQRAIKLAVKYAGCASENSSVTPIFFGGIAVNDVGGLCERLAELYKEIDKRIHEHYRKIFAERLKRVRKELKMTQAAFGASLGLSQRAISNYELGFRQPDVPTLAFFARRLKCPVGWLIGVD